MITAVPSVKSYGTSNVSWDHLDMEDLQTKHTTLTIFILNEALIISLSINSLHSLSPFVSLFHLSV